MKKKQLLNTIMRITVLNIAIVFTLIGEALASNTSAQVLNQRLTLNMKDKELSKVLAAIEKEANVTFIYSPVLIQTNNKVIASFKNEPLSSILSQLLIPQLIKYELSSNVIVLNRIIRNTDAPGSGQTSQVEGRQALQISGNVVDDTGAPLIGVSVTLKGGTTAVSTDKAGNYKISVPDNTAVLVFRYIGFLTQEVPVNDRLAINIKLVVDPRSLNEVVVVGYGSQKRSTLTGATSSLKGASIANVAVPDIEQALQGQVAGLSVTNNGSPGTSPIVTIRGISSISFATDPLYVIDGYPTGNLAMFDSKDVESIEVLKDASAAAIYGSRATNGVILITTKKGSKSNKVTVSLDSYAGIQSPSKELHLLNTQQYVQYATALDGAAGIALPPRLQPANFNLPIYAGSTQTYAETNTNWQNEYFRHDAPILSNNISLNGGDDLSHFYISAGYFKQDGIAAGLSFDRYNFRANSEHKLSKVFSVGQTLYTAVGDQHFDATGGSNRTPLTNVIRMAPYLPDYDPTTQGGFRGPISSFDGADPTNPVEYALIGNNETSTLKILGTLYAGVNFTPWLSFKSTFGVDYTDAYTQNYTPIYNDGGTLSAALASIANQRSIYLGKLFTQQLTFNKTYGEHHINAVAVYETQSQNQTIANASGNQSNNLVKTLNGGSNIAATNDVESNLLISYVGRITYDYAAKYLLSASIRRDGLSIWAPGHKYQDFPSASIGWKIDQEDFLRESKVVSELKLRAGYGITGIPPSALGNYPYLSPIQSNQAYYPFGGINGSGNASYTNGLSNPDLSWETTRQLNIGIDLGLINNKFTLTADYYQRKTTNLILAVPTSPSEGFGGAGALENIAAMQNKGLDLQLGYHKRDGEFKYDITGLISFITNKVLSLNSPTASIVSGGDGDFGSGYNFTKTIAGQSVGQFYGWKTDGLFQTAQQVANSPFQTSLTAPGDIKYQDINHDGKIDGSDETYLGSPIPKFTYSLNYSASYKNFDIGVFFQGVYGNKILNAENIILQGMPRLFNSSTAVLDAWTPSNTNTTIPRAISGDPNDNDRLSDRWIESGSYLRLKNLVIGYTIPTNLLKSWTGNAISRLKVYVSGQNLLTFTKYTGFDPEVGNKTQGQTDGSGANLRSGVDFGQYPAARVFQFGIQAGF